MSNKSELRKMFLEKRLMLTKAEHFCRSYSICQKVMKNIDYYGYRTIHIFLPIESKKEVDTTWLIEFCKNHKNIQLVIPKIIDDKRLEHYIFDETSDLFLNKWGILEPKNGKLVDINTIELVIIPLVIADKYGNRIGYGKGYYDFFLEKIKVQKWGLSLSPLLDFIPFTYEHDIKLNKCFSPEETFTF